MEMINKTARDSLVAAGFGAKQAEAIAVWIPNWSQFATKDDLAKLESRFEQLETRSEARFEQLESRFEQLETRSDARFEQLETKVVHGQKWTVAWVAIIMLAVQWAPDLFALLPRL